MLSELEVSLITRVMMVYTILLAVPNKIKMQQEPKNLVLLYMLCIIRFKVLFELKETHHVCFYILSVHTCAIVLCTASKTRRDL